MLIAEWEKLDCEDFKRTEPKQAVRLPQAPSKMLPLRLLWLSMILPKLIVFSSFFAGEHIMQ